MHGPKAIERLAALAEKAENEAVSVAAIRELLDRGYGKATQDVKVDGSVTLFVGTGVPRAERD